METVHWLDEHQNKNWYGPPTEVWDQNLGQKALFLLQTFHADVLTYFVRLFFVREYKSLLQLLCQLTIFVDCKLFHIFLHMINNMHDCNVYKLSIEHIHDEIDF